MVSLPFFLLLATAAGLGVGLWLSALNVEYRDFRYVVPFLIQIWLFATPVIYPASRVHEKLQSMGLPAWLYGLNPMVGVVQGFRWALFGRASSLSVADLVASAGASVVLLDLGRILLSTYGADVCGHRLTAAGIAAMGGEAGPERRGGPRGISRQTLSDRREAEDVQDSPRESRRRGWRSLALRTQAVEADHRPNPRSTSGR